MAEWLPDDCLLVHKICCTRIALPITGDFDDQLRRGFWVTEGHTIQAATTPDKPRSPRPWTLAVAGMPPRSDRRGTVSILQKLSRPSFTMQRHMQQNIQRTGKKENWPGVGGWLQSMENWPFKKGWGCMGWKNGVGGRRKDRKSHLCYEHDHNNLTTLPL